MFLHNYKYSLKLLLKSKTLVFWTLAFPLIMSVLFNMAFSNLENASEFKAIDIAVVQNSNFDNNKIFKETLEALSDPSGDNYIFNISYTDSKKAEEMLSEDKITGYLTFLEEDIKITVKSNGMNETIFKYIIEEIQSDRNVIIDMGIRKIVEEYMLGGQTGTNYEEMSENMDYEKIFRDISEEVLSESANIKDTSNSNLSYVMIEYYSLIAMSCLYSGMFSMVLVNFKLANMCAVGKRSSMTPVKKSGMLFGSLTAGYTIQLFGLLALFLFTIFVIGVDYGNNLPMIIVLSLLGSLAGLTMGVAVGTLVKKNENVKTTVLISITMAGCYMSGMMGISMKNVIDKNVPILNMINPVAMITDGLYSLYYYDTLNRFYFDAVSLVIFSVLMMLISWSGLRRQKYDSL